MKHTGMIIKFISLAIIVGCLTTYQVIAVDRVERTSQIEAEKIQAEKRKKADTAEHSVTEDDSKYIDGVYEGIGEGYGGNIKVRVTVTNGQISTIDAYEHIDEDDEYFGLAMVMIDRIIETNDPNTADVVSGATFSSEGLSEAINNALNKAVKQ